MSEKAILDLQNATKELKEKKIVNDLSFQVNKGEIVGLLGPNGAGKTTTMRMMVGLISISEGDIFINGFSVKSSLPKALERVGGIIENPEFYPYLSGYDNLMQYVRMADGVTKERIDEVVNLLGLTAAINKKVKAYSLGMKQRLGIAQALLHSPNLLILDEPTNGLDPAGMREIREYLQVIAHNEGISVLISSHLLTEVEQICDRVVIIQNGRLVNIQNIHQDKQKEAIKIYLELDNSDKASEVMQTMEGLQILEKNESNIIIEISNERIPGLVKALTANEIDIYRIEERKRSLEEDFIEMTGGNKID